MKRGSRMSPWALGLWLVVAGMPLGAQATPQAPPMFLVARGDSVRLLLTESPPTFGGFVVYRRSAAAGSSFERITPQPIRSVRQPAVATGLIGADLPAVRQALGTADDGELLRRLQGDRFAGYVLSLLYPQVAVVLGRHFADGGLQRAASYEYRVVMTDNQGVETDEQISRVVRIVDQPPPAPSSVAATPGPGRVTVTWAYPPYAGDPGDVVIGFHVYRTDTSTGVSRRVTERPVVRNDTGPLEYADTVVANGVRYNYAVRAVDLVRSESAPSATVTATAVDGTPPRMPAGVLAQPGDGLVSLSWQPPDDTDVSGYHVERSTGLDQPYTRLTTTPVPADAPAYADRTVVGGTSYFYRVVAVDASGNASRPSNAISALPVDLTPPAPPTGVSVQPRGRSLEIRWTASPSADVRGYYVYRGDTADRLVRLVEQPVSETSFVDVGYEGAGLSPGGRYTLRVSAVDQSFNESEPAVADAIVPDDEPPGAPTGLQVSNVLGRYVEVVWSPSTALDVRGYEVSRSTPGEPAAVVAEVPSTLWSVRDSAVAEGTAYTYEVVAVDSAGNRGQAAIADVAFGDLAPPPAPRYAAAVLTGTGVEVSWERVVDDDLAGYHVYRALVPTGVFERLTTAPQVALSFSDPGGRAEHHYVIRAVDRSTNESAPSPTVRGREP